MPDGPFKHLRLSSRWKRFAAAAHNDAVDSTELSALAKDALVHEILTDANQALLSDLRAPDSEGQLELYPHFSVDSIFLRHNKTPLSDILQREMAFRLAEQMPSSAAFDGALEAATHDQIGRARTRLQDECTRAVESRELTHKQYDRTATRTNSTFNKLRESDICDALRVGNRNAFKDDVSKKTDLDEGPKL